MRYSVIYTPTRHEMLKSATTMNCDVPTDALEVRQGFADGLLTDCDNCGRTMRNGGDCVCDDDNHALY
jgi:predicted nucleic acid-binding Zn ribbon protein